MILDGVVLAFDEARGDGVLRDEHGNTFTFHCVEIADGSRVVAPGAPVRARRVVGLLGRDEAADVQKL